MPAGSVARVYRPSLGNALGRRPPDSDIFEGHGAFALQLCQHFCARIHAWETSSPYVWYDDRALWDIIPAVGVGFR